MDEDLRQVCRDNDVLFIAPEIRLLPSKFFNLNSNLITGEKGSATKESGNYFDASCSLGQLKTNEVQMVSVLFYTLSTAICCQREEQTTPNHSLAPTLHGKEARALMSRPDWKIGSKDGVLSFGLGRAFEHKRFQAQPKIAVDGQRIG